MTIVDSVERVLHSDAVEDTMTAVSTFPFFLGRSYLCRSTIAISCNCRSDDDTDDQTSERAMRTASVMMMVGERRAVAAMSASERAQMQTSDEPHDRRSRRSRIDR